MIDVGEQIAGFEPVDHDRGRMLGRMIIFGVYHHVEAIRVTKDEHGRQVAASIFGKRAYNALCQVDEGPFQTVEIPGHQGEWVLVIAPFNE